ncbi:MAG TPA: hypothetical protein VFJ51_10495, partial [Nitrososphaeraceae archaeon]|nr:hypothetical protein [Nitrososphaeraceae archaeon]
LGILDSVPGDARVDAYQDVVSTLFNLDFIIHCIVTVLLQDNYLSYFQTDLIFLPAAFHFRMKYGVERESQRHELQYAPEHTGMNLAVVFIVRI